MQQKGSDIMFGLSISIILLLSLRVTYATDNHTFSRQGVHSDAEGTRWAVLIAGSKGWGNYRHQADVCHAYQILKKSGLKDENIVVMMYDDIAYNPENPRQGVIINSPNGSDVYHGVPKDYTGEDVNRDNFFNVILGNKTAINGGSGKVVNSGPNDRIFIFYVDHGSQFMIGMPNGTINANDLNKVLKQKHAMGTYKSMVFYLEACEAGSMFHGLLSKKLNIYATTASKPKQDSLAYYCPGGDHAIPKEYNTCLGDLYSISWIEDWEHDGTVMETLQQQYQRVKWRTANSSTVMEYGDRSLSNEKVSSYFGANSAEYTYVDELSSKQRFPSVHQRDAGLLHLTEKFRRTPEGSKQKLEAKKHIIDAMKQRVYVDNSIKLITKHLYGPGKGMKVMKTLKSDGEAHVDDWDCFKALIHTYEAKCGTLTPYGRKHTRVFANLCNSGIRQEQMEKAAAQACATKA